MVKVIDASTQEVLFRGSYAQCEWFIDEKRYFVLADNDSCTKFWVRKMPRLRKSVRKVS